METIKKRLDAASTKLRLLEIADARERVTQDLQTKDVFTYEFCVVPTNYYDVSLEERSKILKANDISQLCKTIVFENMNYKRSNSEDFVNEYDDITNSRYYCVLVQYSAKIDTELVAKIIINLRQPGKNRLGMSNFNFQLAPEAISDKLTGFIHNGVCPYAMKTSLPIIVCRHALEVHVPRIWMGAGHPDLKLCVSVTDFVRSTNAINDYCSHPR
jgi:prolyl-tRNA editing enzyme YbaK/EbsC (Cys-tRNA(Pro) deacylase)